MNPEIRAAEIVGLIFNEFKLGGWFAAMTPGEQAGWNLAESEWFGDDHSRYDDAPRNRREWAGWLAFWIYQESGR